MDTFITVVSYLAVLSIGFALGMVAVSTLTVGRISDESEDTARIDWLEANSKIIGRSVDRWAVLDSDDVKVVGHISENVRDAIDSARRVSA